MSQSRSASHVGVECAALARTGTIKAARPRRKTRGARESDIQRSIVGYIEAVCPGCVIWAVPNAAKRIAGGRASNGVPGLRKGVYDLSMILPDGRFAAIEVKSEAGRCSDEQLEFGGALTMLGVPCCVARGVEDVRSFFDRIGVETREARP